VVGRPPAWEPPDAWAAIRTIDAHAAGEPLRVVVSGVPRIPGATVPEKRRYAQRHLDPLRRLLIFEPRGHADMYGAIPTEPGTPDGDLGVLFLHNEGWSTMCGHGIVGLVTVAVTTGMLDGTRPIRIDAPAGRVAATARIVDGVVRSVAFENVPSYVVELDASVEVAGLGRVRYDLAFGGAFYAYVDAEPLGLDLSPEGYRRIIETGMAIKRAVVASREIVHPAEPDLGFLYGTIFHGPAREEGGSIRNVCVFAEGEVDRSPTGTGVSGRVAIEHARGRMRIGDAIVVESIIGTRFTGRVARTCRFGGYDAVVPEVEGSAWITGRHEFLVAPDDPLREGFILR
jgi:trans-L-3-hydroxyproline dehydratase